MKLPFDSNQQYQRVHQRSDWGWIGKEKQPDLDCEQVSNCSFSRGKKDNINLKEMNFAGDFRYQ